MGEIWNPFDDGNPVYVELQKQTAINRKTWRIVGAVALLMVISDQAGKRGWLGIGSINKNPYRVIRK